jgi:hypothetical protein
MKKYLVFISYAREDKEFAERLYQDLIAAGVEAWLDIKSIEPGRLWKKEIKKGIENSKYFLALFSRNSVSKRGYVQKEVKEALEVFETFPENEIFLIPIRLDECIPTYDKINELHWLDLFPSWERGVSKLLTVLNPRNIQASELDCYIRENIDTSKFKRKVTWSDRKTQILHKFEDEEDLYIVWDQEYRVVQKFMRSYTRRWYGPYKLSDTEKEEVMDYLVSGKYLDKG